MAITIAMAWTLATVPPLGPREAYSFAAQVAPPLLEDGAPIPALHPEPIDLSKTSVHSTIGALPTEWTGATSEFGRRTILSIDANFIVGTGSARRLIELKLGPDTSRFRGRFPAPTITLHPSLSNPYNIRIAIMSAEAYRQAYAPSASPQIAGQPMFAFGRMSAQRNTPPNYLLTAWNSPLASIPPNRLDGTDPLRYEDVRHIAEGITAEEVAHGWPFLCLYSRNYELRTHSLQAAGRKVSGGIPLKPITIVHIRANQYAPGEPPRNWTTTETRALPLIPIWSGLILNTLICATALWLLTLGPIRLRRALRNRKGHCPHCDYDLNNLDTTRCPECGQQTNLP